MIFEKKFFLLIIRFSFTYKTQFGKHCSKEKKQPSYIKICPPSEESVCTPAACHIWRALGPDTAAPLCSDICRISSNSFHTKETEKQDLSTDPEQKPSTSRNSSFGLFSHHLHSADVLLLLHIYVCEIQPDITDLCCGLSDLGKNISCFSEITLVCQHSPWVTWKKDA